MSRPLVLPIERSRIADIEMTHELRQVAFRRTDEQVKVIGHQRIGEKADGKDFKGTG